MISTQQTRQADLINYASTYPYKDLFMRGTVNSNLTGMEQFPDIRQVQGLEIKILAATGEIGQVNHQFVLIEYTSPWYLNYNSRSDENSTTYRIIADSVSKKEDICNALRNSFLETYRDGHSFREPEPVVFEESIMITHGRDNHTMKSIPYRVLLHCARLQGKLARAKKVNVNDPELSENIINNLYTSLGSWIEEQLEKSQAAFREIRSFTL